MFFKNIWNNFWTQSNKIKYFPADVNDQRRNQNNDENSSNINNPVVNPQISDNPPVGQFQNQTGNVDQGLNMSKTEKLWYYWLLNADVLFHQWFNQQKQFFFINGLRIISNQDIINNHLLIRRIISFLIFLHFNFFIFLHFSLFILSCHNNNFFLHRDIHRWIISDFFCLIKNLL